MKIRPSSFANKDLQDIDFTLAVSSMEDRTEGFLATGLFVFHLVISFLPGVFILLFLPPAILYLYLAIVIPVMVKDYRNSQRQRFDPRDIVADPRPPILYLRSFSSDIEEDAKRLDRQTSEELMFKTLGRIGPVLAIGNPGDAEREMPLLGATRIYVGDDWKTEIEKLIRISKLVVIEADNTESLSWEMEIVRKLVHPQKLLISFLSKYDRFLSTYEFGGSTLGFGGSVEPFYSKFEKTFREIFRAEPPVMGSEITFIYFDENWAVESVSLRPKKEGGYRRMMDLKRQFNFSFEKTYFLPSRDIERALMQILQRNKIIDA
jgi:hypothetical protein